jgi:hypothetical protein
VLSAHVDETAYLREHRSWQPNPRPDNQFLANGGGTSIRGGRSRANYKDLDLAELKAASRLSGSWVVACRQRRLASHDGGIVTLLNAVPDRPLRSGVSVTLDQETPSRSRTVEREGRISLRRFGPPLLR